MELALEEAKRGIDAGDGGPFGALIVKDDKVIALRHNEVVKNNDPTAHAEIVTIREAAQKLANFHLNGCHLYVTAQPCPMCFAAIHWAHIEKVFYCNTQIQSAKIGFDDVLITEIIKQHTKDPIKFTHTPKHQCQELFKYWNNNPHKIRY